MKSIYIEEENLPSAWEAAVIKTWEEGAEFKTEYDLPGNPKSRDVMATIHIKKPFSEPRIHRAFPGGIDDLYKYVLEVVIGAHDHWIRPEEGKWNYTYHQRLFDYKLICPNCTGTGWETPKGLVPNDYQNRKEICSRCEGRGILHINQIQKCIDELKKTPHSRRCQAVTWQAWNDLGYEHATCLQRLWFRVEDYKCEKCDGTGYVNASPPQYDLDGNRMDNACFDACDTCQGKGLIPKLNMSVHMRSWDIYKAGFMNIYAFTELQRRVAKQVGVDLGEYIHVADSCHIYGSYFGEFEGFLNMAKNRKFEDKVWDTSFAIPMFIEGCDILLKEEDMPAKMAEKIEIEKENLQKMI